MLFKSNSDLKMFVNVKAGREAYILFAALNEIGKITQKTHPIIETKEFILFFDTFMADVMTPSEGSIELVDNWFKCEVIRWLTLSILFYSKIVSFAALLLKTLDGKVEEKEMDYFNALESAIIKSPPLPHVLVIFPSESGLNFNSFNFHSFIFIIVLD